MLEVVDLVVGEQERKRVNREGFIKRQWDNTLDQEILEKDRMCLKKVAESLKGPPVAEVTLQCNLLVIEPNMPDSKPHAWAFRFINSKTIASHPARKQERVNLLRLYGYLIQEKILRNPLQMNVYVAELVPRRYSGYEGQDRYPDYFSSTTYWPSEELWKFIGVPFDVVQKALEQVAIEFREQLISGLRNLLPEANIKNIQKNLFDKS